IHNAVFACDQPLTLKSKNSPSVKLSSASCPMAFAGGFLCTSSCPTKYGSAGPLRGRIAFFRTRPRRPREAFGLSAFHAKRVLRRATPTARCCEYSHNTGRTHAPRIGGGAPAKAQNL